MRGKYYAWYHSGPVRMPQARAWWYPPYLLARLGAVWDRLRGIPEDPDN